MNKIRTNLQKYSCLLVCISLIFSTIMSITVYAEETQESTVRIGAFDGSYNYINEDNERSGYGYEFQQAIAAYTGWNYEYVSSDWTNCYSQLENGEIDVIGGISYTEERAKNMLFSDLPMGEEKYYLYMNTTNSDDSVEDLNTLNGKRVGVLEQSTPDILLREWEEKHNLNMQHVNIVSAEDTFDKIESQEIDCFISIEEPKWGEEGFYAVACVGSSEIYFAINKNRQDLKDKLDSAMRRIEHDNPFFKDDLYKRYLLTNSYEILTGEEQEWLKQHKKVRVGYLNTDRGVSLENTKSGKPVGIINNYIEYASACLGNGTLQFELVGFDTQKEQLEALKEKKIDMIFHVNKNANKAEQNGIVLSNTVFEVNIAVLTTRNDFNEGTENRVAVSKDNLLSKWYIAENYPQWKIQEFDSSKKVEQAVRNGSADCMVVKAGQSANSLEDNKIHSVFLTKSSESSFAVVRQNTILLSILNKTLNTMPTSMLSGAYAMYENAPKKVSWADFVKDNLYMVMTATAVFVTAAFLILYYLLKKAKKSQLEAEKANAAKTDFLFNMSHDIRTPMNALLGYNKLMKKELTDPKLLGYQEKIEQSGNLLLSIINNILDMARIESGKAELDESYVAVSDILMDIHSVFEGEAKKKEISYVHEIHIEHNHIMGDATKIQEILVNLISNAIKYTPVGGKVSVISREMPGSKAGYIKIQTEVIDTGIGMSKEFLPKLYEPFARERNTTAGKIAGTGLGMPIIKKYVDLMGGSIGVESKLGEGTRFTVTIEHKIADKIYYEKQSDVPFNSEMKEIIRGKHILMAEDNDLNAEIAIVILEDIGVKIDRVSDGIQCVAKMEQMPAGTYDLILMDIQMPNMDGYKATQAIRRLENKEKSNIPIVAMTANAFEEDKREALERGMNGHIAKPIDIEKFEEAIVSILG